MVDGDDDHDDAGRESHIVDPDDDTRGDDVARAQWTREATRGEDDDDQRQWREDDADARSNKRTYTSARDGIRQSRMRRENVRELTHDIIDDEQGCDTSIGKLIDRTAIA